ncbi:MAG TPA: DUF779 domain-containing protein [Acidisoma sp.]|jgi:hypothetical protein|nr:DUF779 domain-containing protein [Acidisoma sp.]
MPTRLLSTAAATGLTEALRRRFGALVFHLSGGCCEGSAPMCFRAADFRVAPTDVLLGAVAGCPFYVSRQQFAYWAHSQLTIDVVAGGGDSFSLEAAGGSRFIVRSRVFTEAEAAALPAGETYM